MTRKRKKAAFRGGDGGKILEGGAVEKQGGAAWSPSAFQTEAAVSLNSGSRLGFSVYAPQKGNGESHRFFNGLELRSVRAFGLSNKKKKFPMVIV